MSDEKLIPDAAVQAIQDSVKTETITVDGEDYLTRVVCLPPPEPMPTTMIVHRLSGLVEFINHEQRKGDIDNIHIVDYKTVRVQGGLEGRHRKRPLYAQADLIAAPTFPFGSFLDAENFIIKAQTCFVPSVELNQVLAVVGNITDENIKTAVDDGVTQKVTTRKGISLGQETQVPNPVRLAPFRTFAEIEQPSSLFILRLRRNEGELPDVALFEVGDLKWQLEAIEKIKDFIADRVEEIPVIA